MNRLNIEFRTNSLETIETLSYDRFTLITDTFEYFSQSLNLKKKKLKLVYREDVFLLIFVYSNELMLHWK